jgi:stage V sporulation protein D (sporulation-specific penicillin-binding protein)
MDRYYADRERRRKLRQREAIKAVGREKRAKKHEKQVFSRRWRSKKLSIMAFFFVCILAFFIIEISRWQSFAGEAYAMRTLTQIVNRHSTEDRLMIQPMRGSITDRNMQSLAVSTTVYNVFVDIRMLMQRDAAEQANNRYALTEFFGIDNHAFNEMTARDADGLLINNTYYYVVLRGLSISEIEEYEAWVAGVAATREGFRIRDIHIEEDMHRSYPMGSLAASVLGFERGLWWGLEGRFNDYMQGSPGRTMTTFDGQGNLETERISPIHGATVVTTLDMTIQRLAEEIAGQAARDFQAGYGSVIVMQPFTGELFAVAQYPGFDPNHPADPRGIVGADFAAQFADIEPDSQEFFDYLNRVWRNFNITRTYEPGSTYKSITVAKALEEGIISPNSMFYCPGYKYVAGHRIHCSRTWGHGMLTLTQALAVSCNVAHMDIAEMVGRDLFWQYLRDFGYGTLTGVDFPGENPGYIFTVAGLNESELATASFGQRFTATPLQTIASFATLINGGNVVRPHFVSQVIDPQGEIIFSHNAPQVQRRVISRETSDWVRQAMEYVVTEGTGQAAAIEGFAIAGKTATGEQGIRGEPGFTYSLSFIGFFPVDDPQYLIQVLLHEVPEEVWDAGQRSVTPMFRDVAQEIISLRGMVPTRGVGAQNPTIIQDYVIVGNFVGLPVPQAVTQLNSLGFEYEFIGNAGNIIDAQFPAAGTRITGNVHIVLSLEDDGTVELAEVPDVAGQSVNFAREILIGAGFVPRVVFDNYLPYALYDDEHTGQAAVRSQVFYGTRLPRGTEVLIRVRHTE